MQAGTGREGVQGRRKEAIMWMGGGTKSTGIYMERNRIIEFIPFLLVKWFTH